MPERQANAKDAYVAARERAETLFRAFEAIRAEGRPPRPREGYTWEQFNAARRAAQVARREWIAASERWGGELWGADSDQRALGLIREWVEGAGTSEGRLARVHVLFRLAGQLDLDLDA